MARPLSNRGAGARSRATLFVVPTTLAVLCLAGVTTGPAADVREAELARGAARRRSAQLAAVRARLGAFEANGGLAQLDAALERLGDLSPEPVAKVELHGLVRVLAGAVGLGLDTLVVGDATEVGPVGPAGVVRLHEVRLRAQGGPGLLLALVSALRGLRLPVAVLEVGFARDGPDGTERGGVSALLGVFTTAPQAPGGES